MNLIFKREEDYFESKTYRLYDEGATNLVIIPLLVSIGKYHACEEDSGYAVPFLETYSQQKLSMLYWRSMQPKKISFKRRDKTDPYFQWYNLYIDDFIENDYSYRPLDKNELDEGYRFATHIFQRNAKGENKGDAIREYHRTKEEAIYHLLEHYFENRFQTKK
jgi:hypothetical protein